MYIIYVEGKKKSAMELLFFLLHYANKGLDIEDGEDRKENVCVCVFSAFELYMYRMNFRL